MLGNLRGWLISLGIFGISVLMLYYGGRPPQITPPTGAFPAGLKLAALSTDPASLGVKPGDNDCDAGDLYTRVILDYKQRHFEYENHFATNPRRLQTEPPSLVGWVVEAADCSRCNLFAKNPTTLINYENHHDSIEALLKAGTYAAQIGLIDVLDKKYDDAQPYYRGVFVLGERLYAERLRWDEYTAGTDLMSQAADGFAKIAKAQKDDKRAEQFGAFRESIGDYQKSVLSLWQAISRIDGEPLNGSGDMFDIALNGKDPMWRTEAVLKLGRMVYMGNVTAGDQRGARRYLKKMADEADLPPSVKAAAVTGRDLSVDDFRKFGGGS